MIFKITVTKDKEGTYYAVPFSVPEGVVKVTVSYDYYRPTKGVLSDLKPTNCIDFGLQDEKGRFLGWSGSAHSSVSVGEYSSTNGYLCEKINAGEWSVLVGAYHVLPEGVEVTYTVDFEYAGEKLLFGDLHIHSDASDGRYDAFEIAKMAKNKGLDFVALANHNNYSVNFSLPQVNNLTFIPAVEWTHYKGHMNFFGVKSPFENSFIANTEEEMKDLIENAKKRGAVISVNHPKCRICPYVWENEDSFELMEIWNGPMRPTNKRGIEYWTSLLSKGRKIPIVGGSDYHSPNGVSKIGEPVTAVYSHSPSAEDILDAVRKGHAFVSCKKNGPKILLKYGNAKMGDTAKYDAKTPLEIQVQDAENTRTVLVTDEGERVITEKSVFLNKTKFAYVKIISKIGKRILAVSNPIYIN